MTVGQIILAIFTVSLITVTYLFGPLTKTGDKKPSASVETGEWDFNLYKSGQIAALPEDKKQEYNLLDEKLQRVENAEAKVVVLKEMALFFETAGNKPLSADYLFQSSEIENTEAARVAAGDKAVEAYYGESEPQVQLYLMGKAEESYKKASELNPENTASQIKLATTYMDGSKKVMEGVSILLKVLEKDEGDLEANLILGRYGIISGQFDKAVKRLETVLQKDSLHVEAHYYLAEAYLGLGDKAKALSLFEKCKTLVNNSEFSMEIDRYIETLKNS